MISSNSLQDVRAKGVEKHTLGTSLRNEGVDTHRRAGCAGDYLKHREINMPVLTIRSRLSPGPTPNLPPHAALPTTEVIQWLNVSRQSVFNWQIRGTGPARVMHKNRRATYRMADVLHWLEGPSSPTADTRIRAFLKPHMRLAMCATGLMRGAAGAAVRRDLARLDELSSGELKAVCNALDRVRTPWPKSKVGEDRGHG